MSSSTEPPAAGAGAAGAAALAALARQSLSGEGPPPTRWLGWRLRMLTGAVLLGCLGFFLVLRAVTAAPHLEAAWQATPDGAVKLVRSPLPALKPHLADPQRPLHPGAILRSVAGAGLSPVPIDALALDRSARWLTDDQARARHVRMQADLAAALAAAPVTLVFRDYSTVQIEPHGRRLGSLGPAFWLVATLALALYLVGMTTALAHPCERNLVYAAMALCQSASLLFVAAESTPGLDLPASITALDMPVRTVLDLATAAAVVHAAAIHPLRLPRAPLVAIDAWALMLALAAAIVTGQLAHGWWWTQGAIVACMLATAALLDGSYRRVPNPSAIVLRRFALLLAVTALLLGIAIVAAGARRVLELQRAFATTGTAAWTVFAASLLLLLPFLARPQHVVREFALLAAVTTVATSLDLLFVTVYSYGQFTSLALSLFCALGVYVGTRQWLLNQLLGHSLVTAERLFADLHRAVRQAEEEPARLTELVRDLLHKLFEPLQIELVDDAPRPARSRGSAAGSCLLVPLPRLPDDPAPDHGALLLCFARRGRRLFTSEDERLADCLVEQFGRALAFDCAVEQGRREERLRIAQDLHDDIGARLLTLMYRAQSPEIEDYLRHTLLDLKTITRGLAAPTHRLSDAAAEWKADLAQRLTLAGASLDWRLDIDEDLPLSAAQWSALTRVLRELVSNVIAHAQAHRVAIELRLHRRRLELGVTDDGTGADPATWSHGLGLGGVRKRVRQLDGEVEWQRVEPHGIRCRVTVEKF